MYSRHPYCAGHVGMLDYCDHHYFQYSNPDLSLIITLIVLESMLVLCLNLSSTLVLARENDARTLGGQGRDGDMLYSLMEISTMTEGTNSVICHCEIVTGRFHSDLNISIASYCLHCEKSNLALNINSTDQTSISGYFIDE